MWQRLNQVCREVEPGTTGPSAGTALCSVGSIHQRSVACSYRQGTPAARWTGPSEPPGRDGNLIPRLDTHGHVTSHSTTDRPERRATMTPRRATVTQFGAHSVQIDYS